MTERKIQWLGRLEVLLLLGLIAPGHKQSIEKVRPRAETADGRQAAGHAKTGQGNSVLHFPHNS